MTALSESPPLDPLPLRRAWPHLLLVCLAVLAVYAYTMPRTVALEDDGGFIMSAYYAGVAHPPGYPLHTLLAKPFTLLPFGSVALRVHLASAVFGAATCGAIWWIVRALIPGAGVAYLAALALGFSSVFWSQAIIAEVYTLNTLLFFLSLAFALAYLHWRRAWQFAALSLALGLGLSNHWPLMVLASPCLVLVLWPARGKLYRQLPAGLLMLTLGLSPYAWMVLRSQSDPEASFYGPIESLSELAFYLSRRGYASIEQSPSAGWWDKLQFAGFLLREIARQYTLLGALLAAIGLASQWRHWRAATSLGLLAAFLSATFALILVIGFDYDYFHRLLFRTYPLIPYGVMAIWMALGVSRVSLALAGRWGPGAGRIGPLLGAVVVVGALALNSGPNNRRDYSYARDYATALLNSLEPNAVVFTHGDADSFPLGYMHLVEGLRPDIALYNDQGLIFSNRLFDPVSSRSRKELALRRFIEAESRPVYSIEKVPPPIGAEDFGFYKKVRKSPGSARRQLRLNADLIQLFRDIESQSQLRDGWTIWHRNGVILKFAQPLTHAVHIQPDRRLAERYLPDLERASSHYHGLLGRIGTLVQYQKFDLDGLLQWTETAEGMIDHRVNKRDRAALYEVRGHIMLWMDQMREARADFQRAVAIHPHPRNGAVFQLMALDVLLGERDEYLSLRSRFFADRQVPTAVRELDRKMRVGSAPPRP
jgi:hypothetical protein